MKVLSGWTCWLVLASLCAATAVLGGCSDNISDQDITFVSLAEVRELSQSKPGTMRLVDPRPKAEFEQGHIPTAWNIELPQVSDRKDSIDPTLARFKHLIVYGNDPGSGVARAMAKRLMRAGHKGVRMFAGGLAEWRGGGLKVEGSPAPAAASPGTPAPPSGFGQPPTPPAPPTAR